MAGPRHFRKDHDPDADKQSEGTSLYSRKNVAAMHSSIASMHAVVAHGQCMGVAVPRLAWRAAHQRHSAAALPSFAEPNVQTVGEHCVQLSAL